MTLLVNIIFNLIYYSILGRVLLSWLPGSSKNTFSKFIYQVTEPILAPIRNLIPKNSTGIDFSPIILFIILNFLKTKLLLG
tara:strand:- start:361 stop:603 length:243 start_codon:yes stop_codon:yes gene_type:complete